MNQSEAFSDVAIEVINIFNELKNLNIYKSFGPDNFHPKLLKSLSETPSFIASLNNLYRKCVKEQRIPGIWKTANVIPLHKKDSEKGSTKLQTSFLNMYS